MYRKSFPKCTVNGPLDPVPFSHGASEGAIPRKCSTCVNKFEGDCLRADAQMAGYLNLDYGPCGIEGSTNPIQIAEINGAPVFVPEKCKGCGFFEEDDFRGFVCRKDADKWGDSPRSLDWGDWEPDYPLVGLILKVPTRSGYYFRNTAVISREIILLIQYGEKTKALKLFRKVNEIKTSKEAREAIEEIERKLKVYYG